MKYLYLCLCVPLGDVLRYITYIVSAHCHPLRGFYNKIFGNLILKT